MIFALQGYFQTRAPLSHVGETISTNTYLVQEPILQPDGGLEEVFCYSGNAWRGQLRDMTAQFFLREIGADQVPASVFHLLFAGGRLGGDVKKAKDARKILDIPPVSIFGGGVGNRILAGKLKVGGSYPLCREALPVLPPFFRPMAEGLSYKQLTFEKSLTRRDDARITRSVRISDEGSDEDSPEQMRYTAELLCAGVVLAHEIQIVDPTQIEVGAFVSALREFSADPTIGGLGSKGFGKVDLHYTRESRPFCSISDGQMVLSSEAEEAFQAYRAYIAQNNDLLQRLKAVA